MEKQEQRRHRLVLVPCPYQGHINPMFQLGNILHSKGFFITIAHTQFNFPNQSKHPHFNFLPLQDGCLSDTDPNTITNININCKAPLQESLTKLLENNDITCIIYDEAMHYAEEVASYLKLQSIILRTSSAANTVISSNFPRLLNEGCIPSEDSLSLDLVPEFEPLRFKDVPISDLKRIQHLLEKVNDTRSSSAIICNTLDCLERSSLTRLRQTCQIPILAIGPLHKLAPTSSNSSLLEEDRSCLSWLDKQASNSVIYVSMGSLTSVEEKELVEMARGLANSMLPFLWVIKPGRVKGSKWIEFLPKGFKETVGERGLIVKWAPQKEVLAHPAVGGFWSHGGWNSTLESICEGVPMICQARYCDQRINARYLSHVWKIGLTWENEGTEKIVRMLMVEKREEMRQRAMQVKEEIEVCIKKGGSSYYSLNDLIDHILFHK